ncbi:MAG: alpha/beta fold hydrolase [Candidatus Scalinduaceae bacterium]
MDNKRFGMKVLSSNIEKPVCFESRGNNIFGILHKTENKSRKVGVIFVNSGLHYRVGPHRIYVKTSRRLNQLGFSSLRLDFPGIGDSEGAIGDIHFDLFDTEDTLNAIDFFTQEAQVEKVVLLGICAGARNALMTAAKDIRVDGIISWSLPIITDKQKFSEAKLSNNEAISGVAAKRYLKGWMKKSFSIEAWRRCFSSNSNFLIIRSVLWKLLIEKRGQDDKRYREFFKAFETFLFSRRKALFVYGERNIVPKEEFEFKFKEISEGKRHNCEYHIVPDGNHTFASIEAERNVIEKTAKWLAHQYELNKEGLEE